MKEVSTQAFVDDTGKVSLLYRESFVRRLHETFAGKDVTFTVTEREKSITHRQRKWLRGPFLDQVVAHLVEHCGYEPHEIDRDQLHYDFLSVRFGTKTVRALNGSTITIAARRSSDLTVREVSDYMEWVVRYCAKEMDCQIALPDEFNARKAVA